MKTMVSQACRVMLLAAAGLLLAGCEANGGSDSVGNGNGSGGVVDGGGAGGGSNGDTNGNGVIDPNEFPNDGSVPTDVTEGGNPISGNFICTASAQSRFGATTSVGTGGLVGGPLTSLLNLIGGNTVTTLLNSVVDKDMAIDGRLDTHSTFALTAGGLGALNSVDQIIELPGTVDAGDYAVFAVSFPGGTVDLSLLNMLEVRTFRGEAEQESRSYTQNALELLGQSVVGGGRLYLGLKATQAYDAASISLTPGLLSVNVGEAMFVHEMCTEGRFVQGTP